MVNIWDDHEQVLGQHGKHIFAGGPVSTAECSTLPDIDYEKDNLLMGSYESVKDLAD
jgi:hypothetical protein